ncbi:MAG: hypothetical protein CME21_12470 [Gemmatimonadetes bacterium]|nr:hypothetical protein [Gemmatimonadota bacterium]
MMNRLTAFVAVLLLLGFTQTLAEGKDNTKSTGDDATDREMVKLQKKAKGLKTCRAVVSTTIRVGDQEITIVAKGFYKGPGKMRIEDDLPEGEGQLVLSDGSYLWMLEKSENMVTRINLARVYQVTKFEADVHHYDPLRPFRGVDWETIRHTGQDTVGGVVHEAFEAVPLPSLLAAQLPSPPAIVRLNVQSVDGLLRIARLFDDKGNEILVQTFTEVQGNRELADEQFEFIVPAGAHPMDVTNEAIEFFRSAD